MTGQSLGQGDLLLIESITGYSKYQRFQNIEVQRSTSKFNVPMPTTESGSLLPQIRLDLGSWASERLKD